MVEIWVGLWVLWVVTPGILVDTRQVGQGIGQVLGRFNERHVPLLESRCYEHSTPLDNCQDKVYRIC